VVGETYLRPTARRHEFRPSSKTPQKISAKPRNSGAQGCAIGFDDADASRNLFRNWKIAKPKPIKETDVLSQDIIVFSKLRRVRSQPK
jgi:hypothetical protein